MKKISELQGSGQSCGRQRLKHAHYQIHSDPPCVHMNLRCTVGATNTHTCTFRNVMDSHEWEIKDSVPGRALHGMNLTGLRAHLAVAGFNKLVVKSSYTWVFLAPGNEITMSQVISHSKSIPLLQDS